MGVEKLVVKILRNVVDANVQLEMKSQTRRRHHHRPRRLHRLQ
jgi:hypothetical protein